MLLIAVSLTFAVAASLAIFAIVLTLNQQAASIRSVIDQSRAAHGAREIPISSRREAAAIAIAFQPVVRPRRVAAGGFVPARRAPAFSPLSFGPRCAAA